MPKLSENHVVPRQCVRITRIYQPVRPEGADNFLRFPRLELALEGRLATCKGEEKHNTDTLVHRVSVIPYYKIPYI